MTGVRLLDWAIMAVSLFDTILLLWLGLTVLLNADRRTWGIWAVSGGLLLGFAFFVSHSALLGHGLHYASQGMDFWWHSGWIPVVAAPFAWYSVMLWYAGLGNPGQTRLRRRQLPWLILMVTLVVGLIGLLVFANPLPSYWDVARLDLSATPSVAGIPLLILAYPFYNVLCIGLSLDALRYPEPSGRVMGDLARRRARPWLMAASVALLLVSVLVAAVMLWIVRNAQERASGIYADMAVTIGWFDVIIAALIGASVILLGRAIVSYEVFTGKTLPRRGLFRHWRSAVILAAGYGVVVGGSLVFDLRPIYSLLLTTVLMTVFYALFSWQSYADRERYIEHLRPFVASQQLYDRLLTPAAGPDAGAKGGVDVVMPFHALCRDILETRLAHLVALGPLSPLAGPPLSYPGDHTFEVQRLPRDLATSFGSPQTLCVPLDPPVEGGLWAVPLWGTRGLIGVLLLGEKAGGGLYTQEEIEIARASGERIIDTQASAEMARRLMALQRQRLAESQVLDQQTRRVLHDEVLPGLHAALLMVGGTEPSSEVVSLLSDTHHRIADLLHAMPTAAVPEVARLGLVGALHQAVDRELGSAFDEVVWEVLPEAEQRARSIPPLTAEVLFYAAREAIRNAARYGRDHDRVAPFHLRLGMIWRDGLELTIEDDGVGMGGASPADGNSGQGLALHTTMMAVIGGTLAVESIPGVYTRVTLTLPRESL